MLKWLREAVSGGYIYAEQSMVDQTTLREMGTKESEYLVQKRNEAIEYLRKRGRYVPEDRTAVYTTSTTPISFGSVKNETKVSV